MSKIFKYSGAGLPTAGTKLTQMEEVGPYTRPMESASPPVDDKKPLPQIMTGAKTPAEKADRLVEYAKTLSKNGFRKDEMEIVRRLALEHLTDAHGRHLPELQTALYKIEELRDTFTKGGAARFQTTVAQVGAKQTGPIKLPESDQAFWHIWTPTLTNYMSTPELPKKAKYLVIGSGLAGSEAALQFGESGAGKDTVVLEAENAPAREASGRNGGNFEAIAESFYGDYEGLTKERYDFLKHYYAGANIPDEVLKKQAQRQADFHIEWGKRNGARLMGNIEKYGIDADFSPHGWTRIAEDADEEAALKKEVEQLKAHGVPAEFWPPEKIEAELKLPAKFGARVVTNNGNYHPAKYVDGVMNAAIKQGVSYYTNTRVLSVDATDPNKVVVHTNRGDIEVEQLVVAVNAFTRELVPELYKIRPYVSQIQDFEHVTNTIEGQTVTRRKGDFYWNFPESTQYVDDQGIKRGMAHAGGGLDRPMEDPHHPRRSQKVLDMVREDAELFMPETKNQPPSRVNVGPMAFSDDRWISVGHVKTDKITNNRVTIVHAGNGYGGTQALEAGAQGARIAMAGRAVPETPEDLVSPNRLLTTQPLFDVSTFDGAAPKKTDAGE